MARRHLTRGHTAGKKGLRKVFSRNRTLRSTLGPKAREEALNTLRGFKSGGGITPRELSKSYGKWARNTDDNITRAQAKVIRRELKEYAKQSRNDPRHKKEDTRAYLDQIRTGNTHNPQPGDMPTSSDTRNYLDKVKDRQTDYSEPEESSGYSRNLPDNVEDELPPEHEPLF